MCNAVAVGISALSTLLQGHAQRQAYQSQARAAEQNARIADMQATDAIMRSGREEADIRRRAMRVAGSAATQAAASGIAADSATLADIAAQHSVNRERDVAINAINHGKEAWGYNSQAIGYRNQASGYRAAGSNAFLAGVIGAGAQLLTLATPDMFSSGGGKGLYQEHATASLARNQQTPYGLTTGGKNIFLENRPWTSVLQKGDPFAWQTKYLRHMK